MLQVTSDKKYKLHRTKYFDKQKKEKGFARILPESCPNSAKSLPECGILIKLGGGGGGESLPPPPPPPGPHTHICV